MDGTRQYAVWPNSLAPGDVVGDAAAQQAYKELVVAAAAIDAEREIKGNAE